MGDKKKWNEETVERHATRPYFTCKAMNDTVSTPEERDVILELADRIIEHHDPDCILLFGSRARGQARPDSDVDMLVVFENDIDSFVTAYEIASIIFNSPIRPDVTPVDRKRLGEWGYCKAHVYYYAIRDGIHIYEKTQRGSIQLLRAARSALKNAQGLTLEHLLYSSMESVIHRTLLAVLGAERITFPHGKDFVRLCEMVPESWGLEKFRTPLSSPTLKLASDMLEHVEKEFARRGIDATAKPKQITSTV